jgi:hypothetical protein
MLSRASWRNFFLRDDGVIAILPLELASFLMVFLPSVMLRELFDCVKIKVPVLEGQTHPFEVVCLCFDLQVEGHQGVVQEPVLRVEGDVVLTLDKGYVGADVELVLKDADQLEQHLLLN